MLRQNLSASLLLTIVMSLVMGVMAKVISAALGVEQHLDRAIRFHLGPGRRAGRRGDRAHQHPGGVDRLQTRMGHRQHFSPDHHRGRGHRHIAHAVHRGTHRDRRFRTVPVLQHAGIRADIPGGDRLSVLSGLQDEEERDQAHHHAKRPGAARVHPPGHRRRSDHRQSDRGPGDVARAAGPHPSVPGGRQRAGGDTHLQALLDAAHGYD